MSASSTLFANEIIAPVFEKDLEKLKELALKAPLKRSRLCLHLSHEDQVQEMVIVLHRDSHIRPHRHQNKVESFHMIEGSVLISFFDDKGQIQQNLRLTADRPGPFLYRLSAPYWHTVLPLTEFAVFHEVSTGPFSASEYPSWEPASDPAAIQAFREKILNHKGGLS